MLLFLEFYFLDYATIIKRSPDALGFTHSMTIIRRSLDVQNTMQRNSFCVSTMQAFYPVMSTIFTSVKSNDNPNLRIPLFMNSNDNPDLRIPLFMNSNDDVEWWIKIEDKFLKYELPDGIGVNSKAKREQFTSFNFKPLYRLCNKDINYLAD